MKIQLLFAETQKTPASVKDKKSLPECTKEGMQDLT